MRVFRRDLWGVSWLGLLCCCFLVTIKAAAAADYRLSLLNIYTSHGELTPAFRPDITSYSVTLRHAQSQIAITPEIDQTRKEYQGGEANMPIVSMEWTGHESNPPEAASVAVRRQIDLPDYGKPLKVQIIVSDPHSKSNPVTYTVTVYQSREPLIMLKNLEAVDDFSAPVIIDPLVTEDAVTYSAYVNPESSSFTLKATCAAGNDLSVGGSNVKNGALVNIAREKGHHRQIVLIACSLGEIEKQYAISVYSDFQKQDITPPKIVVAGRGRECAFDKNAAAFFCPNPKTQDFRTRLIGFSDPSIRYTAETPDQSIQVRLLNEIPSIPFPYTGVGSLNIVGLAGRYSASWPVHFKGAPKPGPMRFLGWILGIILLILLLSLLIVLGLSNCMGIGTPIGVTEIAVAMTLLVQFFCFSSALRGSTVLTDMTEAMKSATLFWPLPWKLDRSNSSVARFGDVADVQNAYGCLFWSGVIMTVILIGHGIVYARMKLGHPRNTIPHRLSFGNWESRALHWLAFPVATASGMILAHPQSKLIWKVGAGAAFAFYAAWSLGVCVTIRSAIASKKVVWVWHASAREDGELEDESGYWSDAVCDQLLTQPVNRSLFKWFFPWRWVSTVADIDHVSICAMTFRGGEGDYEAATGLYPVNEYLTSHKESAYPLGKNPKSVEVLRTMYPSRMCPGQRLIAGLMRTPWLDILFTFQAITNFHTKTTEAISRDFPIPLTVKTCQLTGPITGGPNHFFYDGARVPFVRIGDTFFRILIGIFMGLTLGSTSYNLDVAMFSLIGILSIALLIYHLVGWPYARTSENWILGALLVSIAATSFAFMFYSIKHSRPSLVADLCLWLNAITTVIIALYACIVIFSIYSAIICPPLEETKFLEKLANCNAAISDHVSGWAVDMPAYNKHGARDLRAQCSLASGSKVHVSVYPSGEDATIEFDAEELADACQGGDLRRPLLSLTCPDRTTPLGYRHINVYEQANLFTDVACFLAVDSKMRPIADSIARNIAHQVESRGKGKAVISLSIIPPRSFRNAADDDATSSGGETSVFSSSYSRSVDRSSGSAGRRLPPPVPVNNNNGGGYVEMVNTRPSSVQQNQFFQ